MAFKDGVEVAHVHAFRGLVNVAKDLDLKVDDGLLTPHEAWAELDKAIGNFPPEPKKGKKDA